MRTLPADEGYARALTTISDDLGVRAGEPEDAGRLDDAAYGWLAPALGSVPLTGGAAVRSAV